MVELERTGPPLTNRRFFDIAPPDKQNIMNEQYEHDARLDAVSIQQWRDQKRITPVAVDRVDRRPAAHAPLDWDSFRKSAHGHAVL